MFTSLNLPPPFIEVEVNGRPYLIPVKQVRQIIKKESINDVARVYIQAADGDIYLASSTLSYNELCEILAVFKRG